MTEERAICDFEPDQFVRRQFAGQDEAQARLRKILESAGDNLILILEPQDIYVQVGQSAVVQAAVH